MMEGLWEQGGCGLKVGKEVRWDGRGKKTLLSLRESKALYSGHDLEDGKL